MLEEEETEEGITEGVTIDGAGFFISTGVDEVDWIICLLWNSD
jgi:hypothetical protein